MITTHELISVLLVPLVVSAVLCVLARAMQWSWVFPCAVGVAFIAGYSVVGIPRLPPRDGTDWLFWAAFPITLMGVLDAILRPRLPWPAALAMAIGAALICFPLVPNSISRPAFAGSIVVETAVAIVLLLLLHHRMPARIGFAPIAIILTGLAGGGAVLALCSIRILGVDCLALASALVPLIFLGGKKHLRVAGIATVVLPLLIVVLTGAGLYITPGVTPLQGALLLSAIVVAAGIASLPVGSSRVRAIAAVLAAAAVVGAVVVPAAVAAKKAAVDDPYAAGQ